MKIRHLPVFALQPHRLQVVPLQLQPGGLQRNEILRALEIVLVITDFQKRVAAVAVVQVALIHLLQQPGGFLLVRPEKPVARLLEIDAVLHRGAASVKTEPKRKRAGQGNPLGDRGPARRRRRRNRRGSPRQQTNPQHHGGAGAGGGADPHGATGAVRPAGGGGSRLFGQHRLPDGLFFLFQMRADYLLQKIPSLHNILSFRYDGIRPSRFQPNCSRSFFSARYRRLFTMLSRQPSSRAISLSVCCCAK